MKRQRLFSSTPIQCLGAVLLVAATAGALLLLGGRSPDRLLVALGYALPVAWSAARWGRWPCACAALAAMLAGELLFIPPLGMLALPSLVAWLLLAALLVGGNLLADRLQTTLARSQDSVYQEYQSVFVHGLRTALTGLHTPAEVTATLATYLQQLLQAVLVEVQVQTGHTVALLGRSPVDGRPDRAPDRILPLRGAPALTGEIRLWGDDYLPPEDSYLLRSLAAQAALALAQVAQQEVEPHRGTFVLAGSRVSATASAAVCDPANVVGQPHQYQAGG
jgi:hypothetical protein